MIKPLDRAYYPELRFFYGVKRQAKDINLGILKDKAEHFFQATGKFKKFNIGYQRLSIEDM